MTDIEQGGIWMYDDNTTVPKPFFAWAPGQPDNGRGGTTGEEDCAAYSEKGKFKIFDVNCYLKLKFFCN